MIQERDRLTASTLISMHQRHEDTVKWHVKNLFAKLSAGTRKQVVSRARLMGILAAAA